MLIENIESVDENKVVLFENPFGSLYAIEDPKTDEITYVVEHNGVIKTYKMYTNAIEEYTKEINHNQNLRAA